MAEALASADGAEPAPDTAQDDLTDIQGTPTEKHLCFKTAKRKSATSGEESTNAGGRPGRRTNAARPPFGAPSSPPRCPLPDPTLLTTPAPTAQPSPRNVAQYRHRYVPLTLSRRPVPARSRAAPAGSAALPATAADQPLSRVRASHRTSTDPAHRERPDNA